jgi:hypothetical protein
MVVDAERATVSLTMISAPAQIKRTKKINTIPLQEKLCSVFIFASLGPLIFRT